MKMKEIFGIALFLSLLAASFISGGCYTKLKTIDRAQELLKKEKVNYSVEDIKYVAIGK